MFPQQLSSYLGPVVPQAYSNVPVVPDPGAATPAPAAPDPAWIRFYDAVNPLDIPAEAGYVALYYDGQYGDAGRAAARRFPAVRWITIYGNAGNCGIADFEPGNPVFENPALLRQWALQRQLRNRPFRVYTDKDNAALAWERLGDLTPRALWWIAVRDEGRPGPAQLAAELAASYGAPVPENRIWGCQNTNAGDYDISDLFLTW